MVTPATSHFNPPRSWDEFEDICADLFSREWRDENTTRYGRQGQRQNGVDIYGRPDGERYAAVQCKGRSKWPPDALTAEDIDAEVTKAKKFRPKLSKFIIATVDPNDVVVQDHARTLTEEHAKSGLFSVHVAAWPELTRRLTQHSDLLNKHYEYLANSEIQRDVREIPERVVQAMLEQLPALGAAERPCNLENSATKPDASILQALSRDLETRYQTALQRSLFPEMGKPDEFQNLADAASMREYAEVSASLRRRVLLRASRSASKRGSVERARSLLAVAQALSGDDSDLPARARIAEAENDIDSAIAILRDQTDPESRSTLLSILLSSRGAAAALDWLKQERLDVPDLSPNGVHTLFLCHLERFDVESLRSALGKLTPEQIRENPYSLFLRAAVDLASVLSVPEQKLPLSGLPLDVTRARVALSEATVAARLDSALNDLKAFLPVAAALGEREARRIAEGYTIWCELLHPYRKVAGLARLRKEMEDPQIAVERLQFAFAYDPTFKSEHVANYLRRRQQLGGLDDSELRAMLVLRLHGDSPGAVARLISEYRQRLTADFPPGGIESLEIQALAMSGEAVSARELFEQYKDVLSDEARAGLEAEVAKAEGTNPVQVDLGHYEATGTIEALRSLVQSLFRSGDDRAVARYSEELYERTSDPIDIMRAAHALSNLKDSQELIRVMEAHPFLAERDAHLARSYGWSLFEGGRLKKAREIANGLAQAERDLHLEIAIAIESGEWESLAAPLGAFLDDVSKHSALELIRAAHLAQASGNGPMMDLLRAAIAKDEPDANVWLGAYTLIVEEGLEDEVPESHQWFQHALALSDADGPIQRFELKELLPQQEEWNKRTKSISDLIITGRAPLIVAATGLRTTIVDILLRNLVRNSAIVDPRKKVAVPLFSGNRRPEACGAISCLAIDVSALLVMGWLGILQKVVDAVPKVLLPATILSELFEGRRRIQHVQKSLIKRAVEFEQVVARSRVKLVRTDVAIRNRLSTEVGNSLASLIREAEATNGIVVRPPPVHKLGLQQIEADLTAHAQTLSDMQTLLTVLVEHGAVDQAMEETARRYFDLQSPGWPGAARPEPARPLFIDGLALIYLQYTGLLEVVLRIFEDVRIEADAHDEALLVIDHNRHVTEVLANIDSIRATIRDANAAGKIVFGPQRPGREEDDSLSTSTLHLLTNMSDADAVVCDDRALNKEAFAEDTLGKRVRALTTLDVIEELEKRRQISQGERESLRHRLRVGGVVLMPVEGREIANAALRSGVAKSAEFKSVEQSIDLARLAEVPTFPREIFWYANVSIAAKTAVFEVWNTESDHQRVISAANMVLELIPNPYDWVARWDGGPPAEWVEAVSSITIAGLAVPFEVFEDEVTARYDDWLEERVLEPIRAIEPERYERIVAHLRTLIENVGEEDGNGTAESPAI